MHPRWEARWVECKVIDRGDISFTQAQERKFPIWVAHGVKIWLICGTDFRGEDGLRTIRSEYNKLFQPPNIGIMLNPILRRQYLR